MISKFSKLSKKWKIGLATAATIVGTAGAGVGIYFAVDKSSDFESEKGELWNLIQETPKETAYTVFINGFVGTSIVEKYMNEVAKNNFKVSVIRGYMTTGRAKEEKEIIKKYPNLQLYDAPHKTTHMKSYFWFDKDKKLIRTLTGSGNFSESAIFKVPSYKEVLYNITDIEYPNVGVDLFCGGAAVSKVSKSKAIENENNKYPSMVEELYNFNCGTITKNENDSYNFKGFDLNDPTTYKSGLNKIKANKQFNKIVERSKKDDVKGLIILTGDGETEVIKDFLSKTNENKINLDIFIGNSDAGFKPEDENSLINSSEYQNRLKIIREHTVSKNKQDTDEKKKLVAKLVTNKVNKTHTKMYVWYNQKYEIKSFWSGSANFAENGIDFKETNLPFREVLLEMNLAKNWRNNLICKVVSAFKTTPSNRVEKFCAQQ